MQDDIKRIRRKKISSSDENIRGVSRKSVNRQDRNIRSSSLSDFESRGKTYRDSNRGLNERAKIKKTVYNQEKGYKKVTMTSGRGDIYRSDEDSVRVNRNERLDRTRKDGTDRGMRFESKRNDRDGGLKNKLSRGGQRKPKKSTPSSNSSIHPVFYTFIKRAIVTLIILGIVGSAVIYGYYKYCTYDMAPLTENTVMASYINKDPIPINEVPKNLKNAFVSIEDERFYEHGGIDIKSMIRAVISTATGNTQGGSTIDMQVSKILLTSSEKTMKRKMMDIRNAIAMNKVMTKDEILEAYVNNAYFGKSTYGVKNGAELYFKKDVRKLDLSQCSMLAGITNNPSRFSEYNEARKRQKAILRKMYELGYIKERDMKDAIFRDVPFKSEIE